MEKKGCKRCGKPVRKGNDFCDWCERFMVEDHNYNQFVTHELNKMFNQFNLVQTWK